MARRHVSTLNPETFGSLLAAAQANAPWAYERLYRSMAPAVQGYLRLQGALEPEDLTSEVFLGAFGGIGGFHGDESGFRSWVFTIAHRRLIDERRRVGRRPARADWSLSETCEPVAGDVEDDALAALAERRVRDLCDSLAPDQRDVLLLRLVGGLTVEQVAHALSRTTASVKALQRRGLAVVRRQLAPETQHEGATL
ncbi:MAG: RNA polymerase sigma factor [Actinomycetota bacterium]|nr:RNA polymerase sigma factor [Actinomycetota bacterium]